MAFMSAEVTDKQDWVMVETGNGTQCVPGELVDVGAIRRMLKHELTTEDKASLYAMLKDYLEIFRAEDLYDVEVIRAYGVRLSASGYMDYTDWETYTNKREALRRGCELEQGGRG